MNVLPHLLASIAQAPAATQALLLGAFAGVCVGTLWHLEREAAIATFGCVSALIGWSALSTHFPGPFVRSLSTYPHFMFAALVATSFPLIGIQVVFWELPARRVREGASD